MTDNVLYLRYVNTPTMKEVYEASNPEEELTESDGDVQELADEYDGKTDGEVAGKEAYYQLMQRHLQHVTPDVDGNEGIWASIKNGLSILIENIKKFFKWLFSFFTSKKRATDQATEKLTKLVKEVGVKEGDVAYPKDYPIIWNAAGKPGNDINWLNTKIGEVGKAINEVGKGYTKCLKEYVQKVNGLSISNGQLSHGEADFKKAETEFVTNLEKVIKTGVFVGGVTLSINPKGRLVAKATSGITKAVPGLKYKATTSGVNSALAAITHTNEDFGGFTTELTSLENVMIATLNKAMEVAKQLELDNPLASKKITDNVKHIVNTALANIKTLETIFFKSINAALSVANVAVDKPSNKEGKAK